MIISTHELRFADQVAERVVFMSGGAVVEQGLAHEVLTRPRWRCAPATGLQSRR
jgi:polar amino acid transport system permease protein